MIWLANKQVGARPYHLRPYRGLCHDFQALPNQKQQPWLADCIPGAYHFWGWI